MSWLVSTVLHFLICQVMCSLFRSFFNSLISFNAINLSIEFEKYNLILPRSLTFDFIRLYLAVTNTLRSLTSINSLIRKLYYVNTMAHKNVFRSSQYINHYGIHINRDVNWGLRHHIVKYHTKLMSNNVFIHKTCW